MVLFFCKYGRSTNEFNIINCTITENMSGALNGNGYDAAGIRTLDADGDLSPQAMRKRIWNSIIENNHASKSMQLNDGRPDLYYGDVNFQNSKK